MGMKGYGMLSAVGGEYLKQSGEERAAKVQTIRDKRLSELRQEDLTHGAALQTTENLRKEGALAKAAELQQKHETGRDAAKFGHEASLQETELAAKGPATQTTAGGARSDYWDSETQSWKQIANQPKTFGPTSGSAALAKWQAEAVTEMDEAKTQTTRGDLYERWLGLAYDEVDNPEFPGMGLKIKRRRGDIKGWIEWHNSMVQPENRLKPHDPKYMVGDPQALYEYYMSTNKAKEPGMQQKLIEKLMRENDWWGGPEGYTPSRGGAGGDQVQQQFGGKSNFVEMSSQNQPPITKPTETKEAAKIPDAAGVIPPGAGMLKQGKGVGQMARANISSQSGTEITTSTASKIADAEQELKSLEGKPGRSAQARKKELRELIKRLKKMD